MLRHKKEASWSGRPRKIFTSSSWPFTKLFSCPWCQKLTNATAHMTNLLTYDASFGLAASQQMTKTDVFRVKLSVPVKGQPAWGTKPVDVIYMRGDQKWFVISVPLDDTVKIRWEIHTLLTGLSKSSETRGKNTRSTTKLALCRHSCRRFLVGV